jgi:hypothetical protein
MFFTQSLQQHIQKNYDELDDPVISDQRRRYLENETELLEDYQNNHPDETRDPTPLELFCDSHPDSLECRVYES